jgi:hypothetical protein
MRLDLFHFFEAGVRSTNTSRLRGLRLKLESNPVPGAVLTAVAYRRLHTLAGTVDLDGRSGSDEDTLGSLDQ